MELFATSLQRKPIEQVDVHKESRVCAYCEFCWGWDVVKNLLILHSINEPGVHLVGHASCVQNNSNVEVCKC